MSGVFIALEGIDGAGLTTQANLLEQYLKLRGYNTFLTKEPTNGLIGGLVRACLRGEWRTSNRVLQLLFTADRAHHLEYEIIPALNSGRIVICDRYMFSTIAYGSLELEYEWLKQLNSKFPVPDLTVIIDVKPETSIMRIRNSRVGYELFEDLGRLENVRKVYVELIVRDFKNIHVVNGEESIDQVHSGIKRIVDEYLSKNL